MSKEKRIPEEELLSEVKKDADKKIKSKTEGKEVLFGLGFFGVVGWSVAIPTVLAIALGVYLDKRFDSNFSWTLTLLLGGVVLGFFNVWHWLNESNKED